MKRLWLLLLLATSNPGLAEKGHSNCPPEGAVGLWSRQAIYLCPQYTKRNYASSSDGRLRVGYDYARDMSLKSPDGKATARVGYEHWWVEMDSRKMVLGPHERNIAEDDSSVTENAEFAWAPDSRSFYFTQSENRAGVQGFYTLVFRIVDGRIVHVLDVNRLVQREFNRHHECVAYDARSKRYSEESDIGAVKWVGSEELLMVAETTYDSQCDRGYFAGYLVSLAERKVTRRYSARELMREWSDSVGDRLKNGFQQLTESQKDAEP